MPLPDDVTVTATQLSAYDGVALAADHFVPQGRRPTYGVLIAPAMGVPRGYYRGFAASLAQGGAQVLVPDYRGIGGSGPAKQDASLRLWGEADLSAAAARLRAELPDCPWGMSVTASAASSSASCKAPALTRRTSSPASRGTGAAGRGSAAGHVGLLAPRRAGAHRGLRPLAHAPLWPRRRRALGRGPGVGALGQTPALHTLLRRCPRGLWATRGGRARCASSPSPMTATPRRRP
jgi:predicted alpha/beta hydrolase